MSNSVDEEVLSMKFNNSQFESGVKTSLGTLSRLKESLKSIGGKVAAPALTGITGAFSKLKSLFGFSKEKQSLAELQNQANRTNLGGLGAAVQGVTQKFSVLKGAAAVALGSIAANAARSAASFAKGFTVGPILDGLHEYETNLKAIQTVQANTDQPLTKVNASLAELNKYSDQTIYNFGEMARNVGTFTAAGVDLKTSVSSIKGISNLAALAGSSSEQASTAMYQLSQAIAAGRVNLQDWNSVVNAGMGGKKLQGALATTAQAMGTLKDSSVKLEGPLKSLKINGESFRESISTKPGEKPWLTAATLTTTLASLDGRFSLSALLAEKNANGMNKYTKATAEAKIQANRLAFEQKNGVKYSDAQFQQLRKLSDASYKSATQVKTLGQVFDIARETIGSGWAASFTNIFGTLDEAKKTFTSLSNTITGFINANAMARNKVLLDWKTMGGRAAAIESIKNIFKGLISVIKPIHDAFRDIFPRKTGAELAEATKNFEKFTEKLRVSSDTANKIRTIFRGVFSVFHILGQVVGGVIHYFTALIPLIGGNTGGGFLGLVASIASAITKLDQFLSKGDKIKSFFDAIINARAQVFGPIIAVIGSVLSAFGALITGGPKAFVAALGNVKATAITAFNTLVDRAKSVIGSIGGVFDVLPQKLREIGGPLAQGAADLIQSVVDRFKQFAPKVGSVISAGLAGVKNIFSDIFGKDDVDRAQKRIGQVGETAKQLPSIGDRIKAAFSNLSEGFQRGIAKLGPVVEKVKDAFDQIKEKIKGVFAGKDVEDSLAVVNTALFAGFFLMVRRFFKQFSDLVEPLAKLGDSISGVLDQTTKNLKTMQNNVKADILLKIASSVGILAASLVVLSTIDAKGLKTGLIGVGALMAILAVGLIAVTKAVGKGGLATMATLYGLSKAMQAMGVALLLMSGAVKIFSTMDWGELARGLVGIGVSMAVIIAGVVGLNKAGGTVRIIGAATAIGILAGALILFAGAVKLFASIDVGTLASGGLKVAAVLVGLGLALSLFPKTSVLSAAAIGIVAVALTLLAGAIKLYSAMDVGTIVKGLAAIAASLVVLGLGLAAMSGSIAGSAALVIAAGAINLLVPAIAALGSMKWSTIFKGITALALVLGTLALAAALLTPAVPVLLGLGAAIALLGGAVALVGVGMAAFATGLATLAVSGTAGFAALTAGIVSFTATLPLIVRNIGKAMMEVGKQIIANAPVWGQAMKKSIGALLKAITGNIPAFGKLIGTLITTGLKLIANNIGKWIDLGAKIIGGFLSGVARNVGKIVKPAADLVIKFLDKLGSQAGRLTDAGARFIIKVVNGVATAINKHAPELGKAGARIAGALINGMTGGLLGKGLDAVKSAASQLADAIPGPIKDLLGIASPSRLMHWFGEMTGLGLSNGLYQSTPKVEKASTNMAQAVNRSLQSLETDLPTDLSPTITPVLDLTQLTKDANSISGLMPDINLTRTAAADISNRMSAAQAAQAGKDAQPSVVNNEFKIEQNNNSPKALSEIEIYRNTKNVVALAKEALDKK